MLLRLPQTVCDPWLFFRELSQSGHHFGRLQLRCIGAIVIILCALELRKAPVLLGHLSVELLTVVWTSLWKSFMNLNTAHGVLPLNMSSRSSSHGHGTTVTVPGEREKITATEEFNENYPSI